MSDKADISKWLLAPYMGPQFTEARDLLERWAGLQPDVFIPATPESLASAKAYLDEHMDTDGLTLDIEHNLPAQPPRFVVGIVQAAQIEAVVVEGTIIT